MTIGTPKKDLFNKSFLGEAFQDESQRWLDIGLIDLACYAPDPYKLCFQNKYKWTCKVIQPTSWIRQPLVNKGKFSDNDFTEDLFECKLNGRSCLRLDTDLGDEMRPLESKDVFIDVKVGDIEAKKRESILILFFFFNFHFSLSVHYNPWLYGQFPIHWIKSKTPRSRFWIYLCLQD